MTGSNRRPPACKAGVITNYTNLTFLYISEILGFLKLPDEFLDQTKKAPVVRRRFAQHVGLRVGALLGALLRAVLVLDDPRSLPLGFLSFQGLNSSIRAQDNKRIRQSTHSFRKEARIITQDGYFPSFVLHMRRGGFRCEPTRD